MINGLVITDVNIFPVKNPQPNSNLRAYCKIVLNDALVISSMRIVDGKNGLFIGFPSNWNADEQKNYDITFPITAELREYITETILTEYEKKTQALESVA